VSGALHLEGGMALKDPVKRKAYHSAYRASHREEKAAYAIGYNAAHRAEQIAYAASYHASHRAEHAAFSSNRRATRRGAAGRLTGADILALWDRQPACVRCGEGRGVDHIVALADGGLNVPGNLQTLCNPCNVRKEREMGRINTPERLVKLQAPKTPETRAKMRASAIARWSRPGAREALISSGRTNACARWNVGRGKPCACGRHVTAPMVVG
jgi:5-methylcytosine-specific restriction endonuclease McrA